MEKEGVVGEALSIVRVLYDIFFLDIFACNKHIWGHDHLALPSISVSLRQVFHLKVSWHAAYTPLGFHHRWGDSFAFRTFQIMDQLQQGLWQVFVCSVSKCLTKSMKCSMSWMLALFISGERPYSTGELQFFDNTFWYAILITFSFNFEILSLNKEHSLSFQEGILIHSTRQSHHSLSPNITLLLAIKQGHASRCCSIRVEGEQQDHRRGSSAG